MDCTGLLFVRCPSHVNQSTFFPGGKKETRAYLRQKVRAPPSVRQIMKDCCIGELPYLPFTLHFSPRASSASATERGTPTTTSALFVRRLRRGNACASGPTEIVVRGKWRGRWGEKKANSPTAVSNGVSTGHWTSPVNLSTHSQFSI